MKKSSWGCAVDVQVKRSPRTVELKEKQPTEGLEVGKGQPPSRWRYSYAALCILCIVRSRHSVRELRALSAEELTDTIHLNAVIEHNIETEIEVMKSTGNVLEF